MIEDKVYINGAGMQSHTGLMLGMMYGISHYSDTYILRNCKTEKWMSEYACTA